jgi:hypothetical protein
LTASVEWGDSNTLLCSLISSLATSFNSYLIYSFNYSFSSPDA